MYESPITIIESAMDSFCKDLYKDKEDAILASVRRSLGVDVDRSELLQALQYDRFQYEKGYADGKRDAEADLVRCKDCKHFVSPQGVPCCDEFMGLGFPNADGSDFCSYGERREEE